jgi:hypothetical protein
MSKMRLKIICISLALVLCIGLAGFTWYEKIKAIKEYKGMLERRSKITDAIKVAPTTENILIIKKDSEWFYSKNKELKDTLAKKKINVSGRTPLEFKEELLSSQVKLKQLAGIQGCKMDESLGFSEYVSGEIPPGELVPLLSKQLIIINELIDIMLKYKVNEIISIARSNNVYTDKKNTYKEMAFSFEVNCTIEELLGVLKDIINAQHILIVRDVDIQKTNENDISAKLLIGAVEIN